MRSTCHGVEGRRRITALRDHRSLASTQLKRIHVGRKKAQKTQDLGNRNSIALNEGRGFPADQKYSYPFCASCAFLRPIQSPVLLKTPLVDGHDYRSRLKQITLLRTTLDLNPQQSRVLLRSEGIPLARTSTKMMPLQRHFDGH